MQKEKIKVSVEIKGVVKNIMSSETSFSRNIDEDFTIEKLVDEIKKSITEHSNEIDLKLESKNSKVMDFVDVDENLTENLFEKIKNSIDFIESFPERHKELFL